MDIFEQLAELGIKNKTASAYLALLKLKNANAHQIAKEAKIERTTIYNVMEELVEKQLATKSLTGKRLSYIAESPERFRILIRKQDSVLDKLLPVLLSMTARDKAQTNIKYYEGKNNIGKALMDSLRNNKEKTCRDLASVHMIAELFGDTFISRYVALRVKLGIKLLSLRTEAMRTSPEVNWYLRAGNKDVLREVRYLGPEISFEAFIKCYDDKLLMISPAKKPFAVEIQSTELTSAVKALYDIAWVNARKS